MSVDNDCSPEIAAMIGASTALAISDIPWNGPIGGVFMGLVDGKLVVNPTEAEQKVSDLQLTVAASMEKVVMIEAGANEVDDDTMYEAIMMAHREIKDLLGFINAIVDEIGKPKFDYPSCELDHDMFDKIFDFCEKDVMFALDTDDKTVRDARIVPIMDAIKVSAKRTKGYKGKMLGADLLIYGILFVAGLILTLLSQIPILGILFGFANVVVSIVTALFLNLFLGLVQSAFYEEINAKRAMPQIPENV
jgi:polyribonucleotide nucleotidyltransferase